MKSPPVPFRRLSLLSLLVGSGIAICILFASLSWLVRDTGSARGFDGDQAEPITVFAAAGMRYPLDQIANAYMAEYGTPIQIQYGGSNTMLSQLEVGQGADLYIAADEQYVDLARDKGLVNERMAIASQIPVIVTRRGGPHDISDVSDLYQRSLRYAIGDPHAAAIGKKTKEALSQGDAWTKLVEGATVLKPTVNEIATAVSLGSVDAGIVWDSTAAHYPELEVIRDPRLSRSVSDAELAITSTTDNATGSLHFARYLTSVDRGLPAFRQHGFTPIQGDYWEETPQITFFAGAVNRRAVEPAIEAFEKREGVKVNTIYNGCGLLTAQMRALHNNRGDGFPDSFMACDVYYMDAVQDLFMSPVNISDTEIVMVVPKGNPKEIVTLEDLTRPGIRVAIGQPRQCTIGTLTRRLLEDQDLETKLLQSGNIVTETTSSALLVPNIVTEAADVAVAYRVDAQAVTDQVDIVPINSPLAKAIQPFGISKQSRSKRLNARLFDTISAAKGNFVDQGFTWRLVDGERPAISAPTKLERDDNEP